MKIHSRVSNILYILTVVMCLAINISCNSSAPLLFSHNEWHADLQRGRLESTDGSYALFLGKQDTCVIVHSANDVEDNKHLENYLKRMLKKTGLQGDTILAYLPVQGEMWLRVSASHDYVRPKSYTVGMDNNEDYYTSWVENYEHPSRQPGEMFTYTFADKSSGWLVIKDEFDYCGSVLARLRIIQYCNSYFLRAVGVEHFAWAVPYDPTDIDNIEMISNWTDSHRDISRRTYLLGQDKLRLENWRKSSQWITKADSCYMAKAYSESLMYFQKVFEVQPKPQGNVLYNAACVASLAGDVDKAFEYLKCRAEFYPDWYSAQIAQDADLYALHNDARWEILVDTLSARQERIESHYDKQLMKQLQDIVLSDQRIRYEYISARGSDQISADSLLREMNRIDSINILDICNILDTRGFVGDNVVGPACGAFWTVIQHASTTLQKKYLPVFREAAARGDLTMEQVAMMEDRINVFEGRPQKYGTQIVNNQHGVPIVAPLLDAAHVDQWRQEVGMMPLSQYASKFGAKWGE